MSDRNQREGEKIMDVLHQKGLWHMRALVLYELTKKEGLDLEYVLQADKDALAAWLRLIEAKNSLT